jgi:hypothetical protein
MKALCVCTDLPTCIWARNGEPAFVTVALFTNVPDGTLAAALAQVYIRNCGTHRIEIGHQMFVMKRLEAVAQAVVLGDSKDERKRILQERLSEIVLPTTFKLPLSPHLNVRNVVVSCF